MFITATILSIFAFLISFFLFLPSLSISKLTGAIDYPSARKIHSIPTARGGGISLFFSFALLMLVSPIRFEIKIPLILGGGVAFIIGFLDDARSLDPFQKLSGITLACGIYIFTKQTNSIIENILIFIWLIFITNATNLSDGLNGLAGGTSASQALCLAAISIICGNMTIFLISSLLLGSIVGFLPRNFPNAKIFMGDCGALFLGFTLGAISSELIIEHPTALSAVSIYLIFRMTIADAVLSFLRRAAKGKNPFKADKGHFHHRLLNWGFTTDCAALALVSASLFFGLIGVIIFLI